MVEYFLRIHSLVTLAEITKVYKNSYTKSFIPLKMEGKKGQKSRITPNFTSGHFQCPLITCVGCDFCLPGGGCSFLVRWAARRGPLTLSITRVDLHFKWRDRQKKCFVPSSCKLVRKLHFPSRRPRHSDSRSVIMFRPCLAIQSG